MRSRSCHFAPIPTLATASTRAGGEVGKGLQGKPVHACSEGRPIEVNGTYSKVNARIELKYESDACIARIGSIQGALERARPGTFPRSRRRSRAETVTSSIKEALLVIQLGLQEVGWGGTWA